VLGFHFLALWFDFLAFGFQFLASGPDSRRRRKKVQFLAPNPLKTLPRLQKCRNGLAA
jgi:hypothetical protein